MPEAEPNGLLFGLAMLIGGVAAGWFLGGWVMWQSITGGWDHPWRKKKG